MIPDNEIQLKKKYLLGKGKKVFWRKPDGIEIKKKVSKRVDLYLIGGAKLSRPLDSCLTINFIGSDVSNSKQKYQSNHLDESHFYCLISGEAENFRKMSSFVVFIFTSGFITRLILKILEKAKTYIL